MPLTYYYDLMSQPCRAVYIFLKASAIPFQAKEVALRKLEHLTDDYAQINPFRKVPAIDDSGFILTERYSSRERERDESCSSSAAILAYLADKHQKHHWYPGDLKERARVNEYLHWQHLNLRASGSMLFQSKVEREKKNAGSISSFRSSFLE